jgi:hypothetical protein
MGLQINPPIRLEGPDEMSSGGDDWGTRIAKLIPAEALGLYGSAVGMVKAESDARSALLWLIVVVCCVLLVVIRFRSARDPTTGKPQMVAILISLASFLIWLLAIGQPTSPIGWPEPLRDSGAGPLVAFLWGTMVPYFYRG